MSRVVIGCRVAVPRSHWSAIPTPLFDKISQLLGDSFSVSQQPPICEFPSHSSLFNTLDFLAYLELEDQSVNYRTLQTAARNRQGSSASDESPVTRDPTLCKIFKNEEIHGRDPTNCIISFSQEVVLSHQNCLSSKTNFVEVNFH